MIINTAGEYTLQYTATDACGNSTTVNRELTVEEPPTYRTVLYKDGTFIINESSRDEAANVQAHGQPTIVYEPFDPNGDTDLKRYVFADSNSAFWSSYRTWITSFEIGSEIRPTSLKYWFTGLTYCTNMDLSKLNTELVTDMEEIFRGLMRLANLDLSNFNTSAVTSMKDMFQNCNALVSLDLSSFDTGNVTDMYGMFTNCTSLNDILFDGFNTINVTNMTNMFYGCIALTSLDLSDFDTRNVTHIGQMFHGSISLESIYVSASFVVTQVTGSSYMFSNMSTNLVGGAGTVWSSSNPQDKTYAHIDGGVSDPGYFTAKS